MHLQGSRWHNYGAEHGLPADTVFTIFFDREGNLWTSSRHQLWVLRRDAKRFCLFDKAFSVTQFVQSRNGEIWIAEAWTGMHPLKSTCRDYPVHLPGAAKMLIDSSNRLWIAEDYYGVSVAMPEAPVCGLPLQRDHFTAQQGLSSDHTLSLLQDRDGNIWIGTARGLDRLRPTAFRSYSHENFHFYPSLAATKDGGVWVAIHGNPLALIKNQTSLTVQPKRGSSPLYVDAKDDLWLRDPWDHRLHCYGPHGRQILQMDTPEAVRDMAAQSITSESSGALLIAFENRGLWRYWNGRWDPVMSPGLPHDTPVVLMKASDGRIWCGYSNNRIAILSGDRVVLDTAAKGIDIDTVLTFLEVNGRIWAGGSNGVVYLDHGHFEPLRTEPSSLTKGVSGMVFDGRGNLWLNGGAGVARIASSELLRSLTDRTYSAKAAVYGESDGILGPPAQLKPTPSAIKDTKGTLWFATSGSLVSIDGTVAQEHLSPPATQILSVRLDDHFVAGAFSVEQPLTLRGGKENRLEFNFVGVDLSTPERVVYRYKLDGEDTDWRQAGNQRQAFYSRLAPGRYTFRVAASNGQDQWNEAASPAYLLVRPAFYQTIWFDVVCAACSIAILWLLYLLRVQVVTSRIRDRLKQREHERLRIARELHDTLLQSIHGLVLRFHFAAEALEPDHPNRPVLQGALDRADALILEGRNRVQDLRGELDKEETFAQTLTQMVHELRKESSTEVQVSEEGTRRPLQPNVQKEFCRIARECLANALAHSKCARIELAISYGRYAFRLQCRDDGVGIPASIVRAGGKKGHWGITGMKERARSLGATLEIWSTPGNGTEVEVTLRSSIAYVRPSSLGKRLRHVYRKLFVEFT